jgi:hypothetical protein
LACGDSREKLPPAAGATVSNGLAITFCCAV